MSWAAAPALPAQTQQAVPGVVSAPNGSTVPARTAYDAVVQGMSCKQQSSGRLDCEYKVGKALWFLIAGVGQQDVMINFFKVNSDADFVASVAPLHGCVVVRPTGARADSTAAPAFVSPVDGKIYRNWNTCASKRRDTERDARPRP
jgi:hypothetical protein